MKKDSKTPNRLTFEIPIELHREIKLRALNKNISIKVWVLQAIWQQIAIEKQYE